MSLTSKVVWVGSTGTTAPVVILLPSTSLKLLGTPEDASQSGFIIGLFVEFCTVNKGIFVEMR